MCRTMTLQAVPPTKGLATDIASALELTNELTGLFHKMAPTLVTLQTISPAERLVAL